MQSTIRRPYKSLTAPSTSSPRGTGSCFAPSTYAAAARSRSGSGWVEPLVPRPPPSRDVAQRDRAREGSHSAHTQQQDGASPSAPVDAEQPLPADQPPPEGAPP